jgi:hypothetical protein
MQAYWYATGNARKVGLAPLVYLIETGTWAPERSTFLRPPHGPAPPETAQWNQFCHQCHATGVEPRVKDPRRDRHRASRSSASPARRATGRGRSTHGGITTLCAATGSTLVPPTDPTIVNHPSCRRTFGLARSAASAIRSASPPDGRSARGVEIERPSHRPGQDLAATRIILRGDDRSSDANRRLPRLQPAVSRRAVLVRRHGESLAAAEYQGPAGLPVLRARRRGQREHALVPLLPFAAPRQRRPPPARRLGR